MNLYSIKNKLNENKFNQNQEQKFSRTIKINLSLSHFYIL